jgi:hypothetical protein
MDARSERVSLSYEDLRTRVLSGGRGPGLAVFEHHGMREWMEVCCLCASATATIERVPATTKGEGVPPETRPEIVSILAGLFLQKRWETTR